MKRPSLGLLHRCEPSLCGFLRTFITKASVPVNQIAYARSLFRGGISKRNVSTVQGLTYTLGPWPKSLIAHSTGTRPDSRACPVDLRRATLGRHSQTGRQAPAVAPRGAFAHTRRGCRASPPEAAALAASAPDLFTSGSAAPQPAASARLASPALLPQRRPPSRPSPSAPRVGPLGAYVGL